MIYSLRLDYYSPKRIDSNRRCMSNIIGCVDGTWSWATGQTSSTSRVTAMQKSMRYNCVRHTLLIYMRITDLWTLYSARPWSIWWKFRNACGTRESVSRCRQPHRKNATDRWRFNRTSKTGCGKGHKCGLVGWASHILTGYFHCFWCWRENGGGCLLRIGFFTWTGAEALDVLLQLGKPFNLYDYACCNFLFNKMPYISRDNISFGNKFQKPRAKDQQEQ